MTGPMYTGPAHPIGYVEVQAAWVGPKTSDELRGIVTELRAKGFAAAPRGAVQCEARVESVADGAGVMHHTMYMGFAPAVASSEPLDPHNMNDAPRPKPGDIEPTDGILPLGSRETKF